MENANLLSAISVSGRLFTVHTPRQFSQKVRGTDHLLCTFGTAGFTVRPLDIGSTRCILIFQVSNRTMDCILKRSARLYVYGDCMEPDHIANIVHHMLTDSD